MRHQARLPVRQGIHENNDLLRVPSGGLPAPPKHSDYDVLGSSSGRKVDAILLGLQSVLGRFFTGLLIQLSNEGLVTVGHTTDDRNEGWQALGVDIDVAVEAYRVIQYSYYELERDIVGCLFITGHQKAYGRRNNDIDHNSSRRSLKIELFIAY